MDWKNKTGLTQLGTTYWVHFSRLPRHNRSTVKICALPRARLRWVPGCRNARMCIALYWSSKVRSNIASNQHWRGISVFGERPDFLEDRRWLKFLARYEMEVEPLFFWQTKRQKKTKNTRSNNKAGGYDQNFYFKNVSKCIFKTFCKNRKRQADSRIHCAQVGWEVETAQNVGGIAIRVGFILVCA